MIDELIKISGQCDGVRCDMAMLVLPEVFQQTWGTVLQTVLVRSDKKSKGAQS